MTARKNKCQISQKDIFYMKFLEFHLRFQNVKFDIYFLGHPWELVFGVIADN